MLRFATWKVVAILMMMAVGVLVIIPSLLPTGTRSALVHALPKWIPVRTIVLGLDLQGGSHVLLQVDSKSVVKTEVQNLRDDVRRLLRQQRIAFTGGINMLPRGVQIDIPKANERARIIPKLQTLEPPVGNAFIGAAGARSVDVKDLGNGKLQILVTDAAIRAKIRHAVDQSIEVLRRRVDALGTTEPNIQRQGNNRVLVEVPGLQNPQKLKKILGTTAKLEFRLVAQPGEPPSEYEMLPQTDHPGKLPVEKRVIVQGQDLTDAQPGFDPRTQEPVVNFRFNIRGGQRFAQVTSENVGRLLAIVLDGKVIEAPRILSPITGGSGQISGHFTVESANNLAILLRAGALPAKLTIIEERTIGPGLGQDSINAGEHAAYFGAALVFIYMLTTYGVFGIFADIALLVHICFIFASLILLQATLTLPGIAGIVLTIGMAVDSNVLIYERIREEVHAGRSIISALDAGFKRAFATIVDSNVTMFVAAAILYYFGSGPVRGFAVSLALGILTTIVTAVTMTRMMIALWYQYLRPTKLPI